MTTSGENQENRRCAGDSLRQPVMRSDLYSMCVLYMKNAVLKCLCVLCRALGYSRYSLGEGKDYLLGSVTWNSILKPTKVIIYYT